MCGGDAKECTLGPPSLDSAAGPPLAFSPYALGSGAGGGAWTYVLLTGTCRNQGIEKLVMIVTSNPQTLTPDLQYPTLPHTCTHMYTQWTRTQLQTLTYTHTDAQTHPRRPYIQ